MSNIETVKLPDGTSYNVKDAAAQTATLVTPLIIDGVTQTTVEGALGALNTGSSDAKKTDLTSIIATGSTNTTGAQIPNGTYFYLNGVFCRAIAGIAVNAAFTMNTNYKETTVEQGLEEIQRSHQTTNLPTERGYYVKPIYLISNSLFTSTYIVGFVISADNDGVFWGCGYQGKLCVAFRNNGVWGTAREI